jgi:hypothetical protein
MSEAMGVMKQIAIENLNKEEKEKVDHCKNLKGLLTLKSIRDYCKEHGLITREKRLRSVNLTVEFCARMKLGEIELDTDKLEREIAFHIDEEYLLQIFEKTGKYERRFIRQVPVILFHRGDGKGKFEEWIKKQFIHHVETLIGLNGCEFIRRRFYHDDEIVSQSDFRDLSDLYASAKTDEYDPDGIADVNQTYLVKLLFGWQSWN